MASPPQATQYSKTGLGTAITQTTEATSNVSITIPAGKGGTLVAVETQVFGILETVVNTGGRVKLHNSSEAWEPFEFFTDSETTVTAGGLSTNPTRIKCNMPLPGNTTVTADFTPQDNQSQQLGLTLFWVPRAFSGRQTFAKSLTGSAVTSTSRATTGTIAIPGGHDGNMLAIQSVVFGTVETVVNSGGLVEVTNDVVDITPTEFYSGKQTTVGAALGGGNLAPLLEPNNNPVVGNSTYTVYFTPYDNQSELLAISIIWES